MLTVGDRLPEFRLTAVVSLEKGREFQEITQDSYRGKWLVIFFWPMDFTFICPTEIADFGKRINDFEDRDVQVLGVSIDTQYVHLAWRTANPELRNLPYPMLSDTKRELASAFGVLHGSGVALRATFVIAPEGSIRWVNVNDLSVGRNTGEVIRVLDGLQSGELCPCNWEKGQAVIRP